MDLRKLLTPEYKDQVAEAEEVLELLLKDYRFQAVMKAYIMKNDLPRLLQITVDNVRKELEESRRIIDEYEG
jgi:hypothetical protein